MQRQSPVELDLLLASTSDLICCAAALICKGLRLYEPGAQRCIWLSLCRLAAKRIAWKWHGPCWLAAVEWAQIRQGLITRWSPQIRSRILLVVSESTLLVCMCMYMCSCRCCFETACLSLHSTFIYILNQSVLRSARSSALKCYQHIDRTEMQASHWLVIVAYWLDCISMLWAFGIHIVEINCTSTFC